MSYFNKDLDDIGFKVYDACDELKPYIYNYWSVKSCDSSSNTNKILSDASLGFTINFSKPYKITLNSQSKTFNKGVVLNGPTKYPTFFEFEKCLDTIGIRFKAGGAYVFFEEELNTLLDKNIEVSENYWGFESLYKKLESKEYNSEKIELIEEFLINRLRKSEKQNSPYIFKILDFIVSQKGDLLVENICEEFSLSKKQIERIFKKELGLSAKLYCRIIRLRNVRDILSSLELENLTKTSYDSGFFDQAHFIKEFKSFMYETPKEYFQNKLEMAKSLDYKRFK